MSPKQNPEPDQRPLIIYVGQDKAGRWLVQGSDRQIEGRFISRGAAISFAKAEGEIHHAPLELSATTLVPFIPLGVLPANRQHPSRGVA